ncbi:MAG: preprotein translocase subunit SecD [Methanomicrobiales archaeon]|nr:preprotein translocase subunit SecD [Methanomicrobiales archaeon]
MKKAKEKIAKSESKAESYSSSDWGKILTDWRVLLILILVIISVIAIAPRYENGRFHNSLQLGLDLVGGSWIQMEFQAEVVGFDTTKTPQDFLSELQNQTSDTEISLIGTNQVEIRTLYTRAELEPLFTAAGGRITSYEQGISKTTSDDVKRILQEKLNTLGTRDVRITTMTSITGVTRYIKVELAGVDINTAHSIVGEQGKFEIRVLTAENATEHVLFGDQITYVGLPSKDPQTGKWGVSFTLSDTGAAAFQDAAIRYGATNNPEAHPLSMLLDNATVFSAPLQANLAKELQTQPIKQLFATTGTGDIGMNDAIALEIHLRAGALPVDVKVIGENSVQAVTGEKYQKMSLYAGIFALITVGLVVLYRYREPAIVLPMVFINASEVIVLLGFSRFFLQLDLPTIAGLIAVLGTGIDQLVIITDEVLHEGKVPSQSLYLKRLSRAVGIIVVSASTVFIAMLPLAILPLSTLQGFAIVTILGTLIGVLITRPAYGQIIMGILSRKGT